MQKTSNQALKYFRSFFVFLEEYYLIPHQVIHSNEIMKKFILAIFVSTALISCDKNAIQQTTDSIRSADSLFTKANDGLKTLDSISKTINDSDGIAQKVILPEIKNQSKKIDSTIKSGGYKIDSINKELEKITKNVVTGTEVAKTLDSANDAINRGESPIKVLTKTADRILKQTKRNNPPKTEEDNRVLSENQPERSFPPERVIQNPLVKTANLEIEVNDLAAAKEILAQKMQDKNAEVVTQKLSQTEGFEREYYTVKVPLKNFDDFISNLNSDLGEMKSKDISSEGRDYISGQLCDVEITLVQKEQVGSSPVNETENEENATFSSKFSEGIGKGFDTLQNVFIALLPFWPFFLICGVVLYFMSRNKKKKALLEKMEEEQKQKTFNAEYIPSENENTKIVENSTSEEPDYSKYQPKK